MNQRYLILTRLVILSMLLLPWTMTQSAEEMVYQTSGEILQLNRKVINIGDMLFKVSPTVKVSIPGTKKATPGDLRIGDYVGVKLMKINNKLYVDTIYLLGHN